MHFLSNSFNDYMFISCILAL